MTINIEAPFSLSQQNRTELEDMISELKKHKIGITQANVFFKMGDGKKPNSITSEIELHVPGSTLFASNIDEHYLVAFTGALDKADRQLRKRKDIRTDYHK